MYPVDQAHLLACCGRGLLWAWFTCELTVNTLHCETPECAGLCFHGAGFLKTLHDVVNLLQIFQNAL